ncbi:MAG: TolB family protein, partial [Acidimicrobiales bacterium]
MAFFSYASNLVEGDTNRAPDVFVYDFDAGVTARASLDSLGRQGSGSSVSPSLSADGRYLAFASDSSSGVAGRGEIFVHDLATGQTALVSVSSAGQRVGDTALFPSISADGRYVAFASPASNLAPGDANNTWDVFLHDLATGATERVSVDSSETENAHPSYLPSISSDGSYVAFESAANFDRRDRNGSWDIYVRDLKRGDTAWVSDGHNHPNSGDGHAPAISADGAVVAFASGAALWMEDTNGMADIYQFRQVIAPGPWTDPRSGLTVGIYYGFGPNERLSESVSDGPANGTSAAPAISADGAVVAFSSAASDLVVGDANGAADVFVHLWEGPDLGGGCLAELISAPIAAVTGVPQHALQTLDHIDKHRRAPPGWRFPEGKKFKNDGRHGTQVLPRFEPDGTPITYTGWDVHPYRPGVGRGLERLVTG